MHILKTEILHALTKPIVFIVWAGGLAGLAGLAWLGLLGQARWLAWLGPERTGGGLGRLYYPETIR